MMVESQSGAGHGPFLVGLTLLSPSAAGERAAAVSDATLPAISRHAVASGFDFLLLPHGQAAAQASAVHATLSNPAGDCACNASRDADDRRGVIWLNGKPAAIAGSSVTVLSVGGRLDQDAVSRLKDRIAAIRGASGDSRDTTVILDITLAALAGEDDSETFEDAPSDDDIALEDFAISLGKTLPEKSTAKGACSGAPPAFDPRHLREFFDRLRHVGCHGASVTLSSPLQDMGPFGKQLSGEFAAH